MTPATVDRMLQHPVSFLSGCAPSGDVAVSSRIRLARNLAAFPFPAAASPEHLLAVRDLVSENAVSSRVFGAGAYRFDVASLSSADREILFERRLASRDFLNRPAAAALLAKADESASLMVNEEDHLRLQGMRPGLALSAVWEEIDKIDTRLGNRLEFAFSPALGFLTGCPTNVGTGMRASVMLHLPGLALEGQIQAVVQGASKLHLAVRGAYGEGSENWGNLFQISNQSTLGESEAEILEHLEKVLVQIIAYERNARTAVLQKNRYTLFDQVGRSYGLLRHAFRLTLPESLQALSSIRLGADLKMFNSIGIETINRLFLETQSAHLSRAAGRPLNGEDADIERAKLFRETLQSAAHTQAGEGDASCRN